MSSRWTRFPVLSPLEQQWYKENQRCGHVHSCVQSEARTLLLQFHTGSGSHWGILQAVRQVQGMLLVSASELKVVDAAWATLNKSGLGCHSDPAAFLSSVRDWYKAQASTAFNPSPPRLNLAAKDNSEGTRAAVGRSARPPSLKDAPVLIQSMSSHSKPLKTKTSVPAIKAADQCPCVKRPIIPPQSRQLASDAACQRDEQEKYPLHIPGTFCRHRGGRRAAKGLPGFKNPPLSSQQIGTMFRGRTAGPPFQNEELKVSTASSDYRAMLVKIRSECPSAFPPHL